MTGLSGLTLVDYYVGTAGAITTSTTASNLRWIGRADTPTSIIVSPNPAPANTVDFLQIEALIG